MSEAKASHSENVSRGYIPYSTPATYRTISWPHQEKMSFQGIMSSKKANHDPGLFPIKGQKSCLSIQTRAPKLILEPVSEYYMKPGHWYSEYYMKPGHQ